MDGENTPPELSNAGKSLHLPKEIIEEILSSLPVKSLLRFRCVSKSWCCLIGSNRFIRTQLEKSKKYQYHARWEIIFNFNSESPVPGLKRGSMNSYSHDPSIYPSPIDDPSHNHLIIGSDIVGHCNGLLCMLKLPGSFFLWNPATRISIELPKLDLEIAKLGFGWDEQSDAYKVFAVGSKKNENENENEEEWIGNVYSSKTNSWKTVEHGSLRLYQLSGEVVCGKLHWAVGAAGGYIETFDLKSEVFGTIEMPFKPKLGFDVWLEPQREPEEERGARLSVVYDDNVTRKVWEMEKYGVKASWTKVGGGAIPSEFASTCMCWKIDDKGEVKFFPREKVVGCSQKYCYIESLVSPAPQECLKQYGDLY